MRCCKSPSVAGSQKTVIGVRFSLSAPRVISDRVLLNEFKGSNVFSQNGAGPYLPPYLPEGTGVTPRTGFATGYTTTSRPASTGYTTTSRPVGTTSSGTPVSLPPVTIDNTEKVICCVFPFPELEREGDGDDGNLTFQLSVRDFGKVRNLPPETTKLGPVAGKTSDGDPGVWYLVELHCPYSGDCKKCKVSQSFKIIKGGSGFINILVTTAIDNMDTSTDEARNRQQAARARYNDRYKRNALPEYLNNDSFPDGPSVDVKCMGNTLIYIDAPGGYDIFGGDLQGVLELTTIFSSYSGKDCEYEKCQLIWRFEYYGPNIKGVNKGKKSHAYSVSWKCDGGTSGPLEVKYDTKKEETWEDTK